MPASTSLGAAGAVVSLFGRADPLVVPMVSATSVGRAAGAESLHGVREEVVEHLFVADGGLG